MKIFLLPLFVLITTITTAQPPQAFNYQSIARNSFGQVLISQNVGLKFSILNGSATGTTVYSEYQNTTTNNFGMFTLSIGKGTALSGNFNTITWATGDKYLKVEIDPTGGTNYSLQGNTQLLSVPYALYAGSAGNSGSQDACKKWVCDANGVRNVSGNVGIRQASATNTALSVNGDIPGIYEGNAAAFNSSSPWHTSVTFSNTSVSPTNRYSFSLGGNNNTEVGSKNFGIVNHNFGTGSVKWALIVNGSTNNIGIGMKNFSNAEKAKSRLHIFNGDVNIDEIGSGIIMKSPNGNCWRITIDNSGNLIRTAITCP